MTSSWKLIDTMQSLRLTYYGKGTYLTQIWALPDLFMKIWEAHSTDQELTKNLDKFSSNEFPDFKILNDRLFRFRNQI